MHHELFFLTAFFKRIYMYIFRVRVGILNLPKIFWLKNTKTHKYNFYGKATNINLSMFNYNRR